MNEQTIQLQETLLSLNEENIEQTVDLITNTVFAKSQNNVFKLVHNIFIMAECRPQQMNQFAKLLYLLLLRTDKMNALKFIPDGIINENKVNHNPPYYFYYCLMKAGFNRNVIINAVVDIFDNSIEKIMIQKNIKMFKEKRIFYGYALFAPELFEENKFEWFDFLAQSHDDINASTNVHSFMAELDQLKANDWKLYKKFRENGWNNNKIYKYIMNDKESKLDRYIRKEKIDLNEPLPWCVFERCELLNHHPCPIHVAAYFNSQKCLNYLIKHGVDVSSTDDLGRTVVFYSIAGGHELIKNIDREKCSYESSLHIAARYFRNNYFDSAKNSRNLDITKNITGIGSILHQAALSNNLKLMREAVDNACDINSIAGGPMCNGTTPLILAIKRHNYEAFKFLLSLSDININLPDANGNTPLHHACKRGFNDFIKILFSQINLKPNIHNKFTLAPIHLCIMNHKTLKTILSYNTIDCKIQTYGKKTALDLLIDKSEIAHYDVKYSSSLRLLHKKIKQ